MCVKLESESWNYFTQKNFHLKILKVVGNSLGYAGFFTANAGHKTNLKCCLSVEVMHRLRMSTDVTRYREEK